MPLSPAETDHVARGLRWLLISQLALFAEVDQEPIGVALALPDYNPCIKRSGGRLFPCGLLRVLAAKRRIKRLRVVAANALPQWQRSGIGPALIAGLLEAALQRGAEHIEFSWIAESNELSHGTLENLGARRTKVYRVYDASL